MTANSSAAILSRLFEPDVDDLVPEAARFMLGLDFDDIDHQRMNDLASKAQAGTVTADEREEFQEYLRVADLLAVLQSKARRSLTRVGQAS